MPKPDDDQFPKESLAWRLVHDDPCPRCREEIRLVDHWCASCQKKAGVPPPPLPKDKYDAD